MASPGTVKTILDKIVEAKTPDRFTQDFLETKLGAKGGSARPVIPLLKRIGFLQQDGSTTELYRKFRNEDSRGAAMAAAMRAGYAELFDRNEYVNLLTKPKLLELINEITGAEKGSRADEFTSLTFLKLKEYADFEDEVLDGEVPNENQIDTASQNAKAETLNVNMTSAPNGSGLNLAYTINLNLPETDDIKVFNAIFKSLNENLLKKTNG